MKPHIGYDSHNDSLLYYNLCLSVKLVQTATWGDFDVILAQNMISHYQKVKSGACSRFISP